MNSKRDYELVQTHWDAALSSDALLPSLADVAQSRVCRASISLCRTPQTASMEAAAIASCVYGVIMTQREYCTCGCAASQGLHRVPTLERLSWQRRWTSMLCEQKLCAGARMRYIIEEKTTSSPRGYVLFGLDLGYIRQNVIFFCDSRVEWVGWTC